MFNFSNKKIKLLIITIVVFIVSIFCVLLINRNLKSFDNWVTPAACVCVFHLVMAYWTLRKAKYRLFDLPLAFLCTTGLFNYGQLILLGFFKFYKFSYSSLNKWNIYPEKIYKNTVVILLTSITFYVIGVLLFSMMEDADYAKEFSFGSSIRIFSSDYTRKLNKKTGVILLIITMPFRLYMELKIIQASLHGGYHETFELGISGYITVLGWISIAGVVLLMLGCKTEMGKKYTLFFFCILYGLEMISGNRGNPTAAILTIFAFYYMQKEDKNISKSGKLKKSRVVALGFLILTVVDAIRIMRGFNTHSIRGVLEGIRLSLSNNVLLQALEEFGGSVANISIVQIYLNETKNWFYGKSYVFPLVTVLPNFGSGLVNEMNKKSNVDITIQQYGIYGHFNKIGGNYISEMYANFGCFWFIGIAIIGCLVVKIHRYAVKHINDPSIGYVVMLFYSVLLWTRGRFSAIVRISLWSAIMIFIIRVTKKGLKV